MKIKFRTLLAIALAVLMGVLTPLQAMAISDAENHLTNTSAETLEKELNDKTLGNYIGNTTLYISDVMLANGDTADEAKKALHDKGYLVYDCDLNEGTDSPKSSLYNSAAQAIAEKKRATKYTYLGYKITTDRSKAITDLNLMDQEGGYEVFDYLNFAEKHMPGVNSMASGMKASCTELKKRLEAGSYPAKVAKEYLDLFYVPEKVTDTVGPKLGDYLLDPNRTEDEYKNLLLVLNTLVLNVVNSQLSLGLTDTVLQTQKADGGLDAEGKVVSQYISYTGITGYTGLKDSNDWLITAAKKMRDDENFADVNKTEDTKNLAYIVSKNGMQLTVFKRAMSDGNLTDTAKTYLESVIIEKDGGAISDALGLGASGCNAYQLLTKGSDKMLCLFFSFMPEYSLAGVFNDVLEICASDYQHRLPEKLNFDGKYDIDWANSVISAIHAEQQYPSTKEARAPYNSEIDSFINYMKVYATQYKEGMEEYKKNGNKITLPEGKTEEQAEKTISDAVDNQTEITNIPNVFHVKVRDAFARYKVSENQSLLDYLISAVDGKKEGDETARAAIFPVVKALGTARMYSVKSCNMLGFLTNTLMAQNELGGTELGLSDSRMDLAEGYGSDNFSVWLGTHKDLTEAGEYVAVTSKKVYNNLLGDKKNKVFSNEIPMKEKLKTSLLKLAFAGTVMLGAAIILYATSTLIWTITNMVVSSASALACMGICGGAIAAAACSCLAVAGVVGVVIVVLTAIVFAILYLIELFRPEPDPVYTRIPTIMIDTSKDKDGELTDVAKYLAVRDPNGDPADINAFKSRKWLALYYTRDESAGSPLVLGPDNSFFANVKGTNARPDDKCMPLSKFLRSKAFNLNNNCYYDNISGKYLYFYTENSLAGKEIGVVGGKYISDIMIAHSTTDDGTIWYLENMSDFEILSETNFSPSCKYNTYIAYKTTNLASEAIRDIRAAYFTDAVQIAYGDVLYNNVLQGDDTMRKCPAITCDTTDKNRVQTPFSYSLYTAKDDLENKTRADAVGDPILTSSLSFVTDLSKVPEGYDVVSYFAGVPIDFDSFDHEDYESFESHYYICYASEKDEITASANPSDTEYLAGFGFFAGSEDWLSESDTAEYSMEKYAELSYGAKLIPTNLTPSLYNNEADRTFLGYVTTKNPKKALTDIAVFTGEPKSSYLPPSIMVGNSSYCACDTFTQGDYYFYGKGGNYRQRWMRPSHTYFTTASTEFYKLYWPETTTVMPRALYGCGPCEGGDAIKIEDVIFSYSSGAAPVNNSKNAHANAHLYRLASGSAPILLDNVTDIGTNWRTVHSVDRYYYDEYDANGNLLSSFDMGLGMDNPKADTTGTGHLYMYYRSGDKVRRRGNFVSNIKLCGSISENNAYNTALLTALAGAEDIINIDNAITKTDNAFKTFGKDKETYYGDDPQTIKAYDNSCYFISVSYSDSESSSVRSARVVKKTLLEEEKLPSIMKLPLYNSGANVEFAQTSVANIQEIGESSISYGMYRSSSGYTTNRVDVRFINIAPSKVRSETLNNAGTGVAEYYVGSDDTTDPFMFINHSEMTAACICLQSYSLDESGQNTDKYIGDIVVSDAVSYDGNMELAAAKLGAMGYPYMIDFDLSENACADGSNTVSALGIRRTDKAENAVKDIRTSSDDLGQYFDANNIRYQRVNEKPVKLSGTDKDGVYLYITYGATFDSMLWSEIVKKNIPLDEVDWFSLDYAEANKDPEFDAKKTAYFAAHPGLGSSVDAYRAELKKNKAIDYKLKKDWEEKSALTNIGFAPADDSPEQTVRRLNSQPVKDIYWAGCSAFREDRLIAPVTESTTKLRACGFNGTETSSGLRFTNNGNKRFTPFGSEETADVSASIFSNRNVWLIIVCATVFVAGLAAAYIIHRKKKKNA